MWKKILAFLLSVGLGWSCAMGWVFLAGIAGVSVLWIPTIGLLGGACFGIIAHRKFYPWFLKQLGEDKDDIQRQKDNS